MANSDAPFGAKPVGQQGGAYNGQVTRYYMPSTDASVLAVGDFVILGGTADADGVPTCDVATAGATPIGIVVGFDWPDRTYENLPNYKPASTETYVLVADDPNLKFIMQEDSVGGALAATNAGQNADIIVATPNTSTGRSQMEIDSSTADTTSTLVVHLEGLYQTEDNEIGDNAIWLCSFNVHQYGSVGTTGV